MIKPFSEIPTIHGERIVLRGLVPDDADGLYELVNSEIVYRYLPTFLFEKKYEDVNTVIERLYGEGLKESLILGAFFEGSFCGLAEMYGFKDSIHKISVGYRFLERYWGKGCATETLKLMVDYLYEKTDIEIITASTMAENQSSANVLRKNGFSLVVRGSAEDWGFEEPTLADKWIR